MIIYLEPDSSVFYFITCTRLLWKCHSGTSDSLCNRIGQTSGLHKEEVVHQKSDNLLLSPSQKEVSLTAGASNADFLQEDLLNLTSDGLTAELMYSHSPKSLQVS